MPGDAIAEVGGGLLRVVGRILVEVFLSVILEVAVQGIGYLICKPFKPDIKSEGWLATTVGLMFWALIAILAYFAYGRIFGLSE